jgi:uncharacterized membrane protein
VPLATLWMGESHFAKVPAIMYGVILLGAGAAYYILAQSLVKHHGGESVIAKAIGADVKGKISIVLYVAAIGLAFVHPMVSMAIYALVALMWLVPDARIEKMLIGND